MENIDNKERLIFYKRITPYYTQEKITETVNVDTDNVILSTHAQKPVITQIYATETETGYTKVEKIEYDAVSGISATTVTRIVNIPDDITKDCKLTMQDLDDNFLTLKDFDIKEGYYDVESNEIHLVRNNPDLPHVIINMDGTKKEEEKEIEPSEDEPQPIDTSVKAVINDNGSVTLTWYNSDGEEITSTLQPYSDKEKEVNVESQVPFIDKAVTNNEVIEVVNEYPVNAKYGDRYILHKKASVLGFFYPFDIIDHISTKLASDYLIWRIPSLEDYELLISNLPCPEGKEGLALKSEEHWNGNNVLGFNARPTNKEETTNNKSCAFCTSDGKSIILTDDDGYIVSDVIEGDVYSLRLVADVESSIIDLENTNLNLLGNQYHIVKIGNQYWIDSNLVCDIDGVEKYDLESEFPQTTQDKVYVIQFNGEKWEQTEIELGQTFIMKDGNGYFVEYIISKNINDNYVLIPKFDAGWY